MRKLFNSIGLLIVFSFASCGSSEKPVSQTTDTTAASKTTSLYTCPMHPEIQSNQPGTCSICKMDLVAATDSTAANTGVHNSQQH